MNKKIAKRWIEALRSGVYKQCPDYFRVDNTFCVLGVLCDLHSKETGCDWESTREAMPAVYPPSYYKNKPLYKNNRKILPQEVREWIGIQSEDSISIANDNDKGVSFESLADTIEGMIQ